MNQESGIKEESRRGQEKEERDLARDASSSAELLFGEFGSSLNGISEKEAKKRLIEYGFNEPAKRQRLSIFVHIVSKFFNPLIIILMIIVIFSVIFGEKISAIIISFMILGSVFLDFIQEYRSGRAVERLNELTKSKATVIRNGKEEEIDISEIVPGDVVYLSAGNIIPADIRLVSCKDLFINQASLTGESFPVEKFHEGITLKSTSISELTNIAFMGSSVVSGTGHGLVVKTGASTQYGQISKSIASVSPETSFDKGIREFTMLMIRFIAVLVVAIFTIILVFKGGSYKEALLFSLAVAVGLTPEMLPMLVTINLSKGAIAMAKKKVIVKKLHSIQNFGAMDVLCTDKTGTITMDKIVLEKHCDVNGKESENVLRWAFLNSYFQTGLTNLLDRAILKHERFSVARYKKVDEVPFDFIRKIMSVVIEEDGHHIIVSKGAPEEIFTRCTHYELDGEIREIHPRIFSKLKEEYDILSGEGFRVLAVAYRIERAKKLVYSKDDEMNMVLTGYMAFLDPAKASVKKTLSAIQELGIEVKILTGDNEIVTKKICRDVDLNIKGVTTGIEIEGLDDESLKLLVEKTTIFARLSPIQKERIIKALRGNGHVVGYLGDGINDAPSLKSADVGISVNNGVDIAKESASIILLEKNLMILQDGVLEGRKVFGNIVKYIKMGASSNFGNMLSMAGATVFLPFLPMLPVQILLNNFLYDISNVSLPTDEVDKEYVSTPRPWNVDFIMKYMIFIGPLSSIYDFLTYAVMWFIFLGYTQTPLAQAMFHTGWFFESLCTQILIIYIIRTNKIPFIESKPSRNLVLTTIAVLLSAFIITVTPVSRFFGFVPLPPLYFVILFIMITTYMLLVQFVKMWLVKRYGPL